MSIEPVRAHAVFAPDALHGRERHVAKFGRELAAAPVRRAVQGSVLERSVQNPSFELANQRPRCATRIQRHSPARPGASHACVHFETNTLLQASLLMPTRRSPLLQSTTHRARHAKAALPLRYASQHPVRRAVQSSTWFLHASIFAGLHCIYIYLVD